MNELHYILPLLILGVSAVANLILIAFFRNFLLTTTLAIISFVTAFISLFYIRDIPAEAFNLLVIDRFGIFVLGLILLSSLTVSVLAHSYLEGLEPRKEEYQVILILGTLGAGVLVLSNGFISFFIGLELLTLSIYILISFCRENLFSIEAAIKYLILAGATAAALLMGMALIYAVTGKTGFSGIADYLNSGNKMTLVFAGGFGLMLVGIGFKMALVPFHLWTPDVYQGAPAPTTAFIATVSKASVVVILVRMYQAFNGPDQQVFVHVLSIIAFMSMLAGNFLALLQTDLKRLLAYSSIAHLGYLLVALMAGRGTGTEAVTFYLVAYLITILAAFGIISSVSSHDREVSAIEAYEGLYWRNPFLATYLTVILLSLAGIPLTIGFIGKYYLLFAGLEQDRWFLILTLIISSVIGLFYYLRVIAAMFHTDVPAKAHILRRFPVGSGILIALLITFILFYGIFPGWLTDLISSIAVY